MEPHSSDEQPTTERPAEMATAPQKQFYMVGSVVSMAERSRWSFGGSDPWSVNRQLWSWLFVAIATATAAATRALFLSRATLVRND